MKDARDVVGVLAIFMHGVTLYYLFLLATCLVVGLFVIATDG